MPPELHESIPPPHPEEQPLVGAARNEVQFALARQYFGATPADDAVIMRWVEDGHAQAFAILLTEDPAFRHAVEQYREHGSPESFAAIRDAIEARRLQ